MRRISTATRVVDKFGTGKDGFTNGDAVAGLPSTDLEDVWFDHVQEEIANVVEGAGLTLDPANRAQLLAAIQAMSSPVVGTVRNLAMSVTASSASATMTADEIIVATALSGRTHRLASFNKTINLATTGAGGMDTGAAPASGYVAIYAIYNPTTQTAALLATNATSAKRPEVYGGANMPAGYTASALVSVWATSGSSQLLPGLQSDREIDVGQFGALSTSTQQASTTALSIAGAVPKNAKTVSGSHQIGSTTNSVSTGILTPTAQGGMGTQAVVANIPGAGNVTAIFSRLKISTPQTIYYSATATGGTMGYTINVSGYSF